MKYEAYHVTWIYPGGKRVKRMHVLQIDDAVVNIDNGNYIVKDLDVEFVKNELVMSLDEYTMMFKIPASNCPKLSCYDYEKMINTRFFNEGENHEDITNN